MIGVLKPIFLKDQIWVTKILINRFNDLDYFVKEETKEPVQLELDLKPKLNVIKNEDKEQE